MSLRRELCIVCFNLLQRNLSKPQVLFSFFFLNVYLSFQFSVYRTKVLYS